MSKKLLYDYAVALEDTEVLEISSKLFLEPIVEYSDIQIILMRNIIEAVLEKISFLGEKVMLLSFASVRDRIAYYLFNIRNKRQSIVLTETREEIADFIGIARPSLSRELGRMQDDGFIQIEGHEVIILDESVFDNIFE